MRLFLPVLALCAALACPLAATAADAHLAVQANVTGYCLFTNRFPLRALTFGEINPTNRAVIRRSAVIKFECNEGLAGQVMVEDEPRGPIDRHLRLLRKPDTIPYQVDWNVVTTPQAAGGMVTGVITLTISVAPVHYRAAPASANYSDQVTVTVTP